MGRSIELAAPQHLSDDAQVEQPETRYAWNGDDSLAFQVMGEGPVDLVYLQGQLSNLIFNWEHPSFARFAHALARFSRLIITDRRGLGCSERFTPRDIPPIETLVDDLRAVLDGQGPNAQPSTQRATAASSPCSSPRPIRAVSRR